jgi:mono/diheme cytochrome c family protein
MNVNATRSLTKAPRRITKSFARLCVCCLLLYMAVALPCFAQNPAPAPKPSGNAQNGRRVYERDGCYECHGHLGQGGAAGKRLAPKPMAYAEFVQYCRRPTGEMPPYSAKILSDAELADIYAYLQSIPAPASKAAAAPAKESK